jgi:hypothetical protein
MRLELFALIIVIFLISSVDGLELKTAAHVSGGGKLISHTNCNGLEDYVNGNGDQTYERSLSSSIENGESSLSSDYVYRRDLSAFNSSNEHYAGLNDAYAGIEHYVGILSNGSLTSNAELKKSDNSVDTSFTSKSDMGSLMEAVIDTNHLGPSYNDEIESVSRPPRKLAETYLEGEFTFDSKLNQQVSGNLNAEGMLYKLESVNLMTEYEVKNGRQVPIILQTGALSPEDAAIVYYNEANKQNRNALALAANSSEANKAFNWALDNISQALDYNPKYYKAQILKGNILYAMGQYEEAISAYDQAIEIDKNSNSLYKKGATLLEMGNYQESISILNEALKLNGTDIKSLEKLDQAVKDLKASGISENSTVYRYYHGLVEFYKGNCAEAKKEFMASQNNLSPEMEKDAKEKIGLCP